MILISVNQQDQRLKILFLRASDKIKGKEYQPLIAQISADRKSVTKELIITNIKIILIANWNKMLDLRWKENAVKISNAGSVNPALLLIGQFLLIN